MYYCCAVTDKGVRSHNEDSVLAAGRVFSEGSAEGIIGEPFIAAVSDGVSGGNAGETASAMCLEGVAAIVPETGELTLDQSILADRLNDIHNDILEYGSTHPECENMQATLCGAAFAGGRIYSFNVGDSRLYRFREGVLRQLTHDHTFAQVLADEGAIARNERKTNAHRNIITSTIGGRSLSIDIRDITERVSDGDILLVCSDGLSDYLPVIDMQEILAEPKDLMQRTRRLCEAAIARGGRDNVSVITLLRSDERLLHSL
ncbi:MAG: serine/threonine-protein phosphatase [Ruminococcus sp.]|nr:serine/threonine-protein phosphatase [Ruminococcus sp.]